MEEGGKNTLSAPKFAVWPESVVVKETSGKQRRALKQRASFGSSCLLGWKLVRRKGAAVGRVVWYNTVMNLPGLYPVKWRWKRFEGALRSLPGWVWLTLGKCHWWQVPWHKLLNELFGWEPKQPFYILGPIWKTLCAENNCFLFLIKKKAQKLLTDSFKDTSANSDLSGVVLCLQQTAAWTSVMPRPYLLAHTEVLPVHIYVTVKTGGLGFFLKYSETYVSVSHQHNHRSAKQLSNSAGACL